jgi:hypothetical protein
VGPVDGGCGLHCGGGGGGVGWRPRVLGRLWGFGGWWEGENGWRLSLVLSLWARTGIVRGLSI